MKRLLFIIALMCVILSTSAIVGSISNHERDNQTINRGWFYGELGFRNDIAPVIILDGSFRDFRGRHLLTGSISSVDSERSNRFQGFLTRNIFLIQTGYRNHIINIIGKFNSYDDVNDEYHGMWRGFVLGYGWTHGWITAYLST